LTNQIQRGYCRDKRIVELVEKLKAVDTEQVHAALFRHCQGRRKAQERLAKLFKSKHLNRTKLHQYIYYIGRKPGQIDHLVATNWVYLWLYRQYGRNLWHWSYEVSYDFLRCDAFAGIKKLDENRFIFVELDRSENKFDKIEKYNRLFDEIKTKKQSCWWKSETRKFPIILVVTESEARMRLIKGLVEKHNVNGLEFQVKLLEEVKKSCLQS
jgi:hypothetical protein